MRRAGPASEVKPLRWLDLLLAGPLWGLALFLFDTADSAQRIARATRRIRADEETSRILMEGAGRYVGGIAVGYLLLGIAGSALLALALRVWFPEQPDRRRWRKAALALAAGLTLWGNLRHAASFPSLYELAPGIAWWADHVSPPGMDRVGVLAAQVLAGLAWRRWRGRSQTPLLGRTAGLVAFLLGMSWLLGNPAPQTPTDNQGLNVLVIGVDSLRPDHLASAGYARDTAPHIDALLAESVVFDSAWTPLARTYPAWLSILSGMLPIHHGVRDNLPEPDSLVPPIPLLPQQLGAAGWHTRFLTDDSRFSYMVPATGFTHINQPPVGTTNFAVSVNEPRYRAFFALLYNKIGFALVPTLRLNQAFGKSYRPALFARAAVDELAAAAREGPFFYALHTCVLHVPGDRSWPWDLRFGQVGYRGQNRFRYSQSGTEMLDEAEEMNASVAEVAAQDIRLYDSGIGMADDMVAALMEGLRESGLLEHTIVVLLSDHGEELWEPLTAYKFGGPNHGFHPYGDGQNKVVLAMRLPGGAHGGEHVGADVRLIDLAPTLAELLGVDWPTPFDGASLLPLVEGEVEARPRPIYIETGLSEPRYWDPGHRKYPFKKISDRYQVDSASGQVHIRPEFKPQLIRAKDRIYQVGNWKLCYRPDVEGGALELYNREDDIPNIQNLARHRPAITLELREGLAPYLEADGIEVPGIPLSAAELRKARSLEGGPDQ